MFQKEMIQVGIAPIGWANDDMPELSAETTFDQILSEMSLAGFTGTEIGNKYPREPAVLKKALELKKMSIASAWFSAFITTKPFIETEEAFVVHRDLLHQLGAKVIVVSEQGKSIQGQMGTPLFEQKPHFSEEEWERLAMGMNRLGKLAGEKGMNVVYHHHMGTGIQTTEEIDRLMAMTNPNLVFLLFDSGHLYLSGEDPLDILDRHISRIRHVHLKDVRRDVGVRAIAENMSFLQAVKEGVFTVPGDGTIDFFPIFKRLADANYQGWILVEAEQDPAKANPLEYALKARDYIKRTAKL